MTKELRRLKKANCPTLSGKSKLVYMIGCDDQNKVFLRIYSNDGGGFHRNEWVALKDIQEALAERSEEITSMALHPLLKGRSVNTQSFLLAALKHEGLVRAKKGRQRKHELCDPQPVMDRIHKLMSANAKAKPARKKTAVKRKATPRRRATRS